MIRFGQLCRACQHPGFEVDAGRHQLIRHVVEGVGQPSQFVAAATGRAAGQIAAGDLFGNRRQPPHRTRQRTSEPHRGDCGKQQEQPQREIAQAVQARHRRQRLRGIGLHHHAPAQRWQVTPGRHAFDAVEILDHPRVAAASQRLLHRVGCRRQGQPEAIGGVGLHVEGCGEQDAVTVALSQRDFAGSAQAAKVGNHRLEPLQIHLQGQRSHQYAFAEHRRHQKGRRALPRGRIGLEAGEMGLQRAQRQFEPLCQLGVAPGAGSQVGAQILFARRGEHHVAGGIDQQQVVVIRPLHAGQHLAQAEFGGQIVGCAQPAPAEGRSEAGDRLPDRGAVAGLLRIAHALAYVGFDLVDFLVGNDGQALQHGLAQRSLERDLVIQGQTGQRQNRHQQVADRQAGDDHQRRQLFHGANCTCCQATCER